MSTGTRVSTLCVFGKRERASALRQIVRTGDYCHDSTNEASMKERNTCIDSIKTTPLNLDLMMDPQRTRDRRWKNRSLIGGTTFRRLIQKEIHLDKRKSRRDVKTYLAGRRDSIDRCKRSVSDHPENQRLAPLPSRCTQ